VPVAFSSSHAAITSGDQPSTSSASAIGFPARSATAVSNGNRSAANSASHRSRSTTPEASTDFLPSAEATDFTTREACAVRASLIAVASSSDRSTGTTVSFVAFSLSPADLPDRGEACPPEVTFNGVIRVSTSGSSIRGRFSSLRASLRVIHGPPIAVDMTAARSSKVPLSRSASLKSRKYSAPNSGSTS